MSTVSIKSEISMAYLLYIKFEKIKKFQQIMDILESLHRKTPLSKSFATGPGSILEMFVFSKSDLAKRPEFRRPDVQFQKRWNYLKLNVEQLHSIW